MEKSLSIENLTKSLVSFQLKCRTIGYDAANPFFKSKYATLTALVSETKEMLAKEGLVVSQLCEDEGSVTTILMHVSGEYLSSKLTLRPVKDDPQGRGSCLTYSRRYSYASILGLVSDEDDDGNAATSLEPKKANITQISTTIGAEGGVKSMKIYCEELAKSLFKDKDGFSAWLIDQDIEKWGSLKEIDYARIYNKLKEKK